MKLIEQFFYEQAKQIGLRRIADLALANRTTDEAHTLFGPATHHRGRVLVG
jgi:hypothetical protein